MTTEARREMFDTGRRSAISTSELGLYSDRNERYNRSRYSATVRKVAIGVMVVISILLIAIFLYDFASGASINSKVNQETKHIYILQNALKNMGTGSRKSTTFNPTPAYFTKTTETNSLRDRSDDGQDLVLQETKNDNVTLETRTQRMAQMDPESRMQNLQNFKLRKRLLEVNDENGLAEGKQLSNHALVYRVRQRFKIPESDENDEPSSEETQPSPFHYELNGPQPTTFQRPRYPQLSQYRYPHSSRNIQDIIQYLTKDPHTYNKGLKFTGYYVNPKKYDSHPELGEMMSNSDRLEDQEPAPYTFTVNGDPLYQYKPNHPADVNLLATSNVRFAPIGLNRYSPYHDPFSNRPISNFARPTATDNQYDGTYAANSYSKKRKPKPFSVMLDIYPITDVGDQTKKSSRPRPQALPEDYDSRKLMPYNPRYPRHYGAQYQYPGIPVSNMPGPVEEEERQQMIFHLNLHPRKKNKLNRHEVLERSEAMPQEERQKFVQKVMSPFDTLAKQLIDHSATEDSKLEEENTEPTSSLLTRYQETSLDNDTVIDLKSSVEDDLSLNSESVKQTNIFNSEGYEAKAERLETSTPTEVCINCKSSTTTTVEAPTNTAKTPNVTGLTIQNLDELDTIEGFQKFADGLLATE